MFQARSPFSRSGARLIASSALVLTATLSSIPFAVDASAAQISSPPRFAAVSGQIGAKAFSLNRTPRIKPSGIRGSSLASRTPSKPPKPPKPPRGSAGDGPSKDPRKPPIIVRPYPVPPVIVTDPVPVVGSGVPGGPPSAGPAAQPPGRPGVAALPPAGNTDYLPDEVVTQIPINGADQAAALLARRFRLTLLDSFDIPGAGARLLRWRIIGADRRPAPTVVRAIGSDRSVGVGDVRLNSVVRLQGEPPAPVVAAPLEQYALAKMQLPQAHVLAQGGDVLVAIIDSAVDVSHPELQGIIADTFDAVGTGDKAHPHGTAIAGAIAAQARLKGTAPAARILAALAFDRGQDRTEGNAYVVAKSVYWASDRGARIINMSFAGPRDPTIEDSLRYARQKGVILVAAAGNKGPLSPPLFPAANPDVIAVTATDANDKVFQQANRGKHIAIAAPGVELFLPGLNGTYQEISGTSFAAAEVSGTIALLVERKPDLTHNDARRILMSTARDLGPPGFDPHFGAGLVDAYRAVLSIAPAVAGSSTTGRAAENN